MRAGQRETSLDSRPGPGSSPVRDGSDASDPLGNITRWLVLFFVYVFATALAVSGGDF